MAWRPLRFLLGLSLHPVNKVIPHAHPYLLSLTLSRDPLNVLYQTTIGSQLRLPSGGAWYLHVRWRSLSRWRALYWIPLALYLRQTTYYWCNVCEISNAIRQWVLTSELIWTAWEALLQRCGCTQTGFKGSGIKSDSTSACQTKWANPDKI